MYNFSDLWYHLRLAEVGHLVFPTSYEGETIKFLFLGTADRSLIVPQFHVFMRVVRVSCRSCFSLARLSWIELTTLNFASRSHFGF